MLLKLVKRELFIDGRNVKECSGVASNITAVGYLALCSFDESYLFSVGFHNIKVEATLVDIIRGGVRNACGSIGRDPCLLEKTANFGVREPPVNQLRLSQNCAPDPGLVGEAVTCTAIVDNLRPSTAATISNVEIVYAILSEDANSTDYNVEVKRVLVNSDLPNPDINVTNCTKMPDTTFLGMRGQVIRCRLASEDEPVFNDAVVIFNIISSKAGDFQTAFSANASPTTTIILTNPFVGPFDGIPFHVREVVNEFLNLGRVFTGIESSGPVNDPHRLCPETDPNDRDTWRIFNINPEFTNISQTVSLRALQYVVRTLSGGNTLINADDTPPAGGVGSTVTVPDSELGPDGILSPGESFHILSNTGEGSFFICLASRSPFQFFVDVLGIPVR